MRETAERAATEGEAVWLETARGARCLASGAESRPHGPGPQIRASGKAQIRRPYAHLAAAGQFGRPNSLAPVIVINTAARVVKYLQDARPGASRLTHLCLLEDAEAP